MVHLAARDPEVGMQVGQGALEGALDEASVAAE
jgi:hypothetical protein